MSDQPWFKFYAADYLLDPDVDAIPREAEALLIRMWCICHREGSCPVDVETLARKTQCSQQYVSQFKPSCEPFFELRDGKLYSRRMEEEKRRSEQARENANKRFKKQPAKPTAEQMAEPRSDSDSDSGFKNPSPFTNIPDREKAKAFRPVSSVENKYSSEVGDAIDFRKLCKARDELNVKLRHGWGSDLTPDQLFREQCVMAGLTLARALEVEKRATQWPTTAEASA